MQSSTHYIALSAKAARKSVQLFQLFAIRILQFCAMIVISGISGTAMFP